MEDRLATWMDRYINAWNTNDPADITALFTDDATYRTEPYAKPSYGHDAIVRFWLDARDEPGQFTFRWRQVALDGDLAVVEGVTHYRAEPPVTYSNLWLVRLDHEGRCTEFTEWYMKHPDDAAQATD